MIRVDSISYSYPSGVMALQEVSLMINRGESVAMVGENGAGKTTLAKHLNGLLTPTSGKVWVNGIEAREQSMAQLAAQVAYAFQNPDDQLFAQTLREEVAFGPHNLGFSTQQIEQVVAESLDLVGLADEIEKHPYDLSPAKRKRLSIAASLAMQSPVLILDEPTVGQDAAGVALIGALITERTAAGNSVILISHDLDFCAEHCERMVVMADGRIRADGTMENILAQKETLEAASVSAPQLVRLAGMLDWEAVPRTVEEFGDTLEHSAGTRPAPE